MNKSIIIIAILAIIVVVLASFLLWPQPTQAPNPNQTPQVVEGIEVFTPKPNEIIASPVKITGRVNGGGWIGFEGEVGIVKLFDANANQLAIGFLTAQGEWMQKEINFEGNLTFVSPGSGTGSLVFYNENPSGDPARDKMFTLPIVFQ